MLYDVIDPNGNVTSTHADVDKARQDALERAIEWGEAFVVESADESFYETIEKVEE